MTDEELIKRLRSAPADGMGTENLCLAGADRIEALRNHTAPQQAKPPHTSLADLDILKRARVAYATSDDVEIDDNATISRSEDGVWVAAWVWLPHPLDEGEPPDPGDICSDDATEDFTEEDGE